MINTKYPFPLRMFGAEAKVRGLFITISCDFDITISHMIAKMEEPEISKRDSVLLKLPYETGKKVKRCKDNLKKYNIDYYNKFLPEFTAMEELLKYRNMLAHGYSQLDENQKDESYIDFICIEKGKYRIDRITLKPFYKNILRFRKHLTNLYELHYTLSQERG